MIHAIKTVIVHELRARILDSVRFREDFDPEPFAYPKDHHVFPFLVDMSHAATTGLRRVLAFGAPTDFQGIPDNNSVVTPITKFHQLYPTEQTARRQRNGVGPHLFNMPHDVDGLSGSEHGVVHAYTFHIDPNRITDMRRRGVAKARGRCRQLMNIAISTLEGAQYASDRAHELHGDCDAAHYALASRRSNYQQSNSKTKAVASLASEFLVIRSSDILLTRVGQYASHSRNS